uniref:Centromere protein S n=1 Tax=Minutocellus polymorphus TaxID=265543 RepID=A0A7S0FNV1_9STRA|mmetsp:Transcript_18699/g.31032  ORF Transcript_18699/g.31032 Transcript_18699/m.31032 type:complete len:252 (+) Transcript_18699:1-756(+)
MESSSDDSDLVGSSRARPRGGGASGADSGDGAKDDGAIRSALHFAVGRICEREEDDDLDVGARMSSTAVSSLTELVYQYATTSLANDLVAFSKHAGRKTVTVDDVKLAIRKDKKTHDSLGRFCEKKGLASFTSTSAAAKGRKKKKASSAKAASGAKRSMTAKSAGNAGTSTKRKSKNEERRQEMRQHINAASSSDSNSMEPSGGDEDSSDDDDSCLQPVKTPIRKKAASNVENDTTDGGETDDMVIDLASD